ncbi:hypothetical protein Nans01_39070 [Nocardiopsis ansamitocini]|uniref:Uncharacterized protein n=1 Tax=Nocardiopsis ansamitocini TaxID=1670832 RepID=A0A9W6P9F3_9ACTN|nr:hypothetical protein Nans01_39070 [Nocardiopsis ansamitocini]
MNTVRAVGFRGRPLKEGPRGDRLSSGTEAFRPPLRSAFGGPARIPDAARFGRAPGNGDAVVVPTLFSHEEEAHCRRE